MTLFRNPSFLKTILIFFAVFITACNSGKNTPEAHLTAAREFISQGKLKDAMIELRNVVALDPDNSDAMYEIGRIHMKNQQGQKAYTYLNKAIAADPDNLDAQLLLGQLYALGKQTKLAREASRKVLDSQPENIKAHHLLATVQIQERAVDAAIRTLNRALKIHPGDAHTYLFLGNIYYFHLKDLSKSETAYKKAMALNPDDKDAYEELSAIYMMEALFDKAEQILVLFSETDGDPLEKYLRLATFYEKQHRNEDAETALLKLVDESEKEKNQALFELALFYIRTQKYPEALSRLAQARQLSGEGAMHDKINYATAEAFYFQKEYDNALDALNALLSKTPNHIHANLLLAKILIRQENYGDALEKIGLAIASGGDDPELYFLKATCLMEKKLGSLPGQELKMTAAAEYSIELWKKDMAIESLKTAVDLAPGFIEARMMLAELLLRNKEDIPAENHILAVIDMVPENTWARAILGEIKLIQDNLPAAEEIYRTALEIEPDFTLALIKLGLIHYRKKDPEKAVAFFNLALDKDPNRLDTIQYIFTVNMEQNQFGRVTALCENHLKRTDISLPTRSYIEYLKARILLAQNKIEPARALLEKSAETYQASTPTHEILARISEHAGDIPGTIARYEHILSYDPEHFPAYMGLSRIYLKYKNNTKRAKEYLGRALGIKDDYAPAANNLAYLLAEDETNLMDAYRMARLAVEKEPGNPVYLDTLGWVYYKQKNYRLAVKAFNDSLKIFPDNPEANYHLAWTYYDTEEYEKARERMKTVLKLAPDYPDADKARSIIGE